MNDQLHNLHYSGKDFLYKIRRTWLNKGNKLYVTLLLKGNAEISSIGHNALYIEMYIESSN